MSMTIKEIFYTLQGEGTHWGMPSVFVRLGHCNLRCAFCDTDFLTDLKDFSIDEVVNAVQREAGDCRNVVFTGGEPLMQQDALVEIMTKLGRGWYFCVETNGTMHMTPFFQMMIDWICVSPKVKPDHLHLQFANEVKVVFTETYRKWLPEFKAKFPGACRYYISPEAESSNPFTKLEELKPDILYPYNTNVLEVIQYVKENPEWRLNLQTHKVLNIR